MEELIRNTNYSEKIENIENYNHNELFLNILKEERFDLLFSNNIKLNISEDKSSLELIDYLFSDEDPFWRLDLEGYSFDEEVREQIKKVVLNKYINISRKFEKFLEVFLNSQKEKEDFVLKNRTHFIEFLNNNPESVPSGLLGTNSFIDILLSERKLNYLTKIDNFNSNNYKLLADVIKDGFKISEKHVNNLVLINIFKNIDDFNNEELYLLLGLFAQKSQYIIKGRDGEPDNFTVMIENNIDRLIITINELGIVPKCLTENQYFRDECIKRNYMNLAVQCILPPSIINDEHLVELYCSELKIDKKDLYEKIKWLVEYSKKNKDIFDTFIANMLKDNIFNISKHHYERIINDIEPQIALTNLNEKSLEVLNLIFNRFNYKDYDVSFVLNAIINNINNFSELIENLQISELDNITLDALVSVLQYSSNSKQIKTIDDLKNFINIKQQNYKTDRVSGDLTKSKENICQYMFNISLEHAKSINKHYCYKKGYNRECILEELKLSELPPELFNLLNMIHKIVEADSFEVLDSYFFNCPAQSVYKSPIHLETFLRNQYSQIMSNSLYKPDAPVKQENGMPDKILKSTEYNGKNVNVCIPRESFNFLVHCVDTCNSDKIDQNYQRDWEGRPQIQDHFVACSYIDEKSIFSIRAGDVITYGFSNLEGGALSVMGDCDIDSIGVYSRKYSAAEDFMKQGGNCNFLVPSMLLEFTGDRYNEVVIERRNISEKTNFFKRTPDYIIMSIDSVDNSNDFILLDDLLKKELPHLTDEEKKFIKQTMNESEIREIIKQHVLPLDISYEEKGIVCEKIVDNIFKSKKYENNLKAAEEFDIPLIVVDQTYYLKRLLSENKTYDDEQKNNILNAFINTDMEHKKDIFKAVARNANYNSLPLNKQNRLVGKIF